MFSSGTPWNMMPSVTCSFCTHTRPFSYPRPKSVENLRTFGRVRKSLGISENFGNASKLS